MTRLLIITALTLAGASALAGTTLTTTEQRPVAQVDTLHTRTGVAQAWGLTDGELSRYQRLMRGPRGAFSVSNISPLEVLGIHAETPAERRRYADRLVRVLYEDTERVLAFERETQAAWRRLGRPMFAPGRGPTRTRRTTPDPGLSPGSRLALFVATRDCPRCTARTRALVGMTDGGGPLSGLDVYVVDTKDAGAIRRFARGVGIAPEVVASRRVTLNAGAALFAQYLGPDRDLPKVFVREGGRLHLPSDPVGVGR